jgi:hypothetical protein
VSTCDFVHDGAQCVFGADHLVGYHHLTDGRNVDAETGDVTAAVPQIESSFLRAAVDVGGPDA